MQWSLSLLLIALVLQCRIRESEAIAVNEVLVPFQSSMCWMGEVSTRTVVYLGACLVVCLLVSQLGHNHPLVICDLRHVQP